MIEREEIIAMLQSMAREPLAPSKLLRYLAIDQQVEDQIELMKLFVEAFELSLGEVTPIAGWWIEEPRELNDSDVDAYMYPLIRDWLAEE